MLQRCARRILAARKPGAVPHGAIPRGTRMQFVSTALDRVPRRLLPPGAPSAASGAPGRRRTPTTALALREEGL